MRGSAKEPPRSIREKAGMSVPAQESPHRATLCPSAPSSAHPALTPSSSSLFPAWLPPVLTLLSPKSLSCGSPPTSPFRATHPPLSSPDSSSVPRCSSVLTQPFEGSFCVSLLPPLVPAPPPARAPRPGARGGLSSGTHRCQPGSGSGELQGEQSRPSGRAKHPMPRTAAHSQPHRSSLGAPGAHRAGGIPEHPQTAP